MARLLIDLLRVFESPTVICKLAFTAVAVRSF
jgi:hypothetical protein